MQNKNSYKMTKAKLKRIFAIFMAINIFFEVASPSVSMALTSGPGQPEMASFEPVGTTDMVDVFSGDFNYNIPLLTVPGPNGGYPINIAYHSGIGMDDEASWVGLGWNINPGVISRNMRGLPDDFSADVITKRLNMRPNRTVNVGFGVKFPEVWGYKLGIGMKGGMVWNNYKGIGMTQGISVSANSTKSALYGSGVSLGYNSLSGETSLTPNLSFAGQTKRADHKFNLSASISSLNGLKNLNFAYSGTRYKTVKTISSGEGCELQTVSEDRIKKGSAAASISFASSAFTPHAEFPTGGFNVSSNFSIGLDAFGVYANYDFNGSYDQTKYKENVIKFVGYGYLNSQNRGSIISNSSNNEYKLMDFNREKDAPLSKDIPSMPVPIATYDTYLVKGQGIGGVFRPYRTDIQLLSDPAIFGNSGGGSIGAEAGVGLPTLNIGVNLALNYSKTYSGPWNDLGWWDGIEAITNKGHAYFKKASEMVADIEDEKIIGMKGAFDVAVIADVEDLFDVSLDPTKMADIMNPFVEIRASGLNHVFGTNFYYSYNDSIKTRSQLMSYKTFDEVSHIPAYYHNFAEKSVYALNANPLTSTNISYANSSGSQIAEMSVINPDGNRYIYALPAKNLVQKEVTFSILEGGTSRNSVDGKIINYDPVDNTTSNTQLEDHFFSSTELPPYVHSYMLTAIVSPDYIDLTDNGLTEDDFGYWVKFNYTKTEGNYKWRMPFNGANYMKGYISTTEDDKAGYTYGEKELWFLNSIETKSHLAKFSVSNRSDSKGVTGENVIYTGSPNASSMELSTDGQQKLDKISLYSKTSINTPLKEVNFTYNYELCKNTLNSNAIGNGKLTLKEVSFSYLGNNKGALSPYLFDYHATDVYGNPNPDENPNYAILKEDCWGNYRDNAFGTGNTIFPYPSQIEDYDGNGTHNDANDILKRNKNASAWNLKEITLPSGGKIKVDYEPDDYAYVHDQKAMELVRIIGFSDAANLPFSDKMKDKYEYLFFEINDLSSTFGDADVRKYIQGVSQVYFNVFMDLKKNGVEGIDKMDYVNGYAEIDNTSCGLASSAFLDLDGPNPTKLIKVGYIKLKKVTIQDKNGIAKTHPFKKAGWQYLKLERKDVLFPATSGLASSSSGGVAFLKQAGNAIIGSCVSSVQLFTGFYKYCHNAGFCRTMIKSHLGTNYPSFIRLRTPDGIKYGGGNRVKQIVITDTWQETKTLSNSKTETESKYGQEYSYRLPDGTSSGVAAYEPLIGGEEIPQRQPIRYSSSYFLVKNENLYMEEPIGESYYPAASVGYSRVIVKNINQGSPTITKTREGITVNEFYTTKDFPYQIIHSTPDHVKFRPKIAIPLIGSVNFENHGFSQFMNVCTNDMHGKIKAISTYAAGIDVNGSGVTPISKIEYIYNTNESGGLSNRVNALFGDAYYKDASMGITEENYIDGRQTFGINMAQGMQTNVDWTIPYVIVPSFMASIDYSESMYKSMVNMKVTSQNGILMETRAYSEGSSVSTKNLMFDAYTGKPLLTTVTTNFDKPIYSYEYAAQWAYPSMGGAYKNDRARITVNAGGIILGTENIFPGDELLIDLGGTTGFKKIWAKPIGGSSADFQAIYEDGSNVTGSGTGTVIRSGRRNQQGISNASIISLTNPVTDRQYKLFTDYNNLSTVVPNTTTFASTDCGSGINRSYKVLYDGYKKLTFTSINAKEQPQACAVVVNFPSNLPTGWETLELKKAGNKAHLTNPTTQAIVLTGDITDDCGLTECLDGVLNVSAAEFKDKNWNYDYGDVGEPVVNFGPSGGKLSAANLATANPYRIGTEGIWRMEKSYAYQTERKQTPNITVTNTTKIQEDGTFKEFVLFDWRKVFNTSWAPVYVPNKSWTMVNEVTKYNPYGFEIENKNAIGIYTSALYGYKNSLQTAIANNARYYETAYESFEDQGATYLLNNGHIKLVPTSGNLVSPAHTGKKSLEITPGQTYTIDIPTLYSPSYYYFQPPVNNRYLVSAWFKVTAGAKPIITLNGVLNPIIIKDEVVIEGWQKVEASFISNSSASPAQNIIFSVSGAAGNSYIDDIRIQPFKSTMKTFVYNPATLWLVAELDNQNYATFYNYDEEGTLTQVKKETVNGIQTLKTTRSNIKR